MPKKNTDILTFDKPKSLLIFLSTFVSVKRDYDYLRKLIRIADQLSVPLDVIYESLLQTYLFAGFPSALNSLQILNFKGEGKVISIQTEILRKFGLKNFKKVYGNKTEKLLQKVESFSKDLADWMIIEGYGKVYSRETLNFAERELCAVASLIPLRFDDQLISHFHGLVKSKFNIEFLHEFLQVLRFIGYKSDSDYAIQLFEKVAVKKRK